jgi:hypothetical protein
MALALGSIAAEDALDAHVPCVFGVIGPAPLEVVELVDQDARSLARVARVEPSGQSDAASDLEPPPALARLLAVGHHVDVDDSRLLPASRARRGTARRIVRRGGSEGLSCSSGWPVKVPIRLTALMAVPKG